MGWVWKKIFENREKCCEVSMMTSDFIKLKALSLHIWQIKWDKVFKNGPSKMCGRQPWSILEYLVANKPPSHSVFGSFKNRYSTEHLWQLRNCYLNFIYCENKWVWSKIPVFPLHFYKTERLQISLPCHLWNSIR